MNTTFSKLLAVGLVISSIPIADAAPAGGPGARMGRRQRQAGFMAQQAAGNHLTGRIKEISDDFLIIEWGQGAPAATPEGAGGGRRRAGRRAAQQGLAAPGGGTGMKITKVRLNALRNFVRHTRGSRADLIPGSHIVAMASQHGSALELKELTVHPPRGAMSEADFGARIKAARFLSPASVQTVAALAAEDNRLASTTESGAGASLQLIATRPRGLRQPSGRAAVTKEQTALTQSRPQIEIDGILTASAGDQLTIKAADGRETTVKLAAGAQPMMMRNMERAEFRVGQSVAVGWNEGATGVLDEIAQPSVLMLTDTLVSSAQISTAPTESASKRTDRIEKKLEKAEQRDRIKARNAETRMKNKMDKIFGGTTSGGSSSSGGGTTTGKVGSILK